MTDRRTNTLAHNHGNESNQISETMSIRVRVVKQSKLERKMISCMKRMCDTHAAGDDAKFQTATGAYFRLHSEYPKEEILGLSKSPTWQLFIKNPNIQQIFDGLRFAMMREKQERMKNALKAIEAPTDLQVTKVIVDHTPDIDGNAGEELLPAKHVLYVVMSAILHFSERDDWSQAELDECIKQMFEMTQLGELIRTVCPFERSKRVGDRLSVEELVPVVDFVRKCSVQYVKQNKLFVIFAFK